MKMGVGIKPFQSITMHMQSRFQQKTGLEKSKIRLKDQSHALVWHAVPILCKEEKEELVILWHTHTHTSEEEAIVVTQFTTLKLYVLIDILENYSTSIMALLSV
jgi:hypothetical protein